MNLITAINQEFARQVQADWSRARAEQWSEHAVLTPRKSLADWLRAMIGAGVGAFGLRQQGQHADPAIDHAQIGQ